ncbi:hypothetical protein VCR15J2_630219 [Vibrio coralliirubri]|nr:hypothetical protein VCR15J2_630219 [Vibrio coralliirubri]
MRSVQLDRGFKSTRPELQHGSSVRLPSYHGANHGQESWRGLP